MTGKIVASSNRTKTSWCLETTPGVTPANPVWTEIFVGSNGLKLTPVRGRSKDLRSDGQAAGTFLTDTTQEGSIPMELKFRMWDWLLQMAVKNTFNNKAVRDNAGTADSVITAVTASSDAYTCTDDTIDFSVGALTLASGFGQSANNLLFRAAAGTSGTSVVSPDGRADEAVPPANAKLQAVGFEGASGDITATASGLASTTLDFRTFNIQPGEAHWVGGASAGNKFTTAANNGWARVSVVAQNALTYDVLPAGWGVDDGSGKSIQVFFPDFLKNGTTIRTASFERQQQDTAAVQYEYFNGDFLNNLTMTITGGKEIDMSAEFIGLGGQVIGTVRFAGSTDVAASTYRTMTATSNLGDLVEGGVSVMGGTNCLSQATLKISNNITRTALPGPVGTAAINIGALMVSGTVDTYLGDGTILAKGINDTLSSFSFPVKYPDGNHEGYRFDCTAIRLTPTSEIPGQNTGRLVSGPFEAEPHATLGYAIGISRFWYLPV
jgi:tail tube protein